jgi:farnesyl diphosphate synthase
MSSFDAWMKAVQAHVEEALGGFLPAAHTLPHKLHEAMRYTTLGGGKRVRPLLVFAAGDLFGAAPRDLERAAAAVEMIHVYSLVHDDMPCMDDDALRRGKPTVHVAYDEATALLVGDALQTQAFSVLADAGGAGDASDAGPAGPAGAAGTACAAGTAGAGAAGGALPPARVLAMLRVLAHAAGPAGMCGGQAIDLDSVGLMLTRAQLEQMHQLKTGALLRAAVLLGALCGKDVSATERAALDVYANAIGLAFQVVDDVLDATADSATLGKTAGKDAAANKPTYVSLLGLAASQELAQELRREAHEALAPFGEQARRLRELADLIVERKA